MASPPSKSSSSGGGGRPPSSSSSGVKFGRRTSSGRVVSLSRDDDIDLSSDYGSQTDFSNYTVLMPPTPDNQPMAGPTHVGPTTSNLDQSKPDGPSPYGTSSLLLGTESKRVGITRRVGGEEEDGGSGSGSGGGGGGKMDRRMSVMKSNKSMLLRSQTGDFDHNRWLFESKGTYGIGNAFWPKDEDSYGPDGIEMSMADFMDKPWKPLTRKIGIPPSILSPYR